MLKPAEEGMKLRGFAREQAAWVSPAVLAAFAGYAVIAPSMAWTKVDDLLYVLGIICGLSLIASYAIGGVTAGWPARLSPLFVLAIALACYVFASAAAISSVTLLQAVQSLVRALWLTAPNIPVLHAFKVVILFAAAAVVLFRLREGENRWFIDWFAGAVAVGTLLFIADSFLGYPMIDTFFGPPIQYRINANIEALSLLLWPALLALSARERTFLAVALWIVMGFAVLRSPSQAAWLGFFAGSVALALTWQWPRASVWLVALCVAAGVIVAPALGWAADMTVSYLPDWFLHASSASRRVEVWLIYARLIEEAPLFGHGFRSSYPGYPTNFAIQIWSELGAVGAALTAALLGLAGLTISNRDPACRPYLLGSGVAVYAQAYVTLDAWSLPALGMRLLPVVVAVQLCRMIGNADRR